MSRQFQRLGQFYSKQDIMSWFLFGIACAAILAGVWLTFVSNFAGTGTSNAATVSFGTAQTLKTTPVDSKPQLIHRNGVYYLSFTTSTDGSTIDILITTSTDGATWTDPVTVYSGVRVPSDVHSFIGFALSEFNGHLGAAFQATSTGALLFVSSSNKGATWSSTSTISEAGGGSSLPSPRVALAFSTSSELVGAAIQVDGVIKYATTTDSVDNWSSSTVHNADYTLNSDNEYDAHPLGVHINTNGTIQVILDTVSSSSGYEIIYASSTDSGNTWTTSSVTGLIANQGTTGGLNELSAVAFDDNGLPGVVYAHLTAVDGFDITYNLVYRKRETDGTWTSSTIASGISYTLGSFFPEPNDLTFFSTDKPIAAFINANNYPRLMVNTSTQTTFTIKDVALGLGSEMSVAYNTSSQEVGVAYVTGGSLTFVTSALRSPDLNNLPTSTAMALTTSTDGSGVITVSTTVTDADDDESIMVVEFSTDDGSSWTAATLGTVSGDGSPATSTNRVTTITDTDDGNILNFTWNSQEDFADASTTTARLRIQVYDSFGTSSARISDAFQVDNEDPSAPESLTVAVNQTTSTFSWGAVSGASTYTVSTTASSTDTSTSDTSVSYTGLSPNTQYTYQVSSIDTFGNSSTFATSTSQYTDPAVPTAVTATQNGSSSLIVTWSSTNGSGTVFELYNVTTESVVATTTATTYTVTGLSASTLYEFKVRAQYLSDSSSYSSYSALSTSVATAAVSGGGGGSSSAPAPSLPTPTAAVAPQRIVQTYDVNKPTKLSVGNASHTVTIASATANAITLTIQSDPVTLTLKANESKEIDTDGDGKNDLLVSYMGLSGNKPQLEFKSLLDDTVIKAVLINDGAAKTTQRDVTLKLNAVGALQMAIANEANFAEATYVSYATTTKWKLSAGNGEKVVFVRFRSKDGAVVDASDSIILVKSLTDTQIQAETTGCSLTPELPYKHAGHPGVYYITADCTKRAFVSPAQYFSYFVAWSDVAVVSKAKLNAVPDDTLGFLPWGPRYTPADGMLIKTPSDSNVYLVVGGKRHHIASPAAFSERLGFAWNWVEDVDAKLLNALPEGTIITMSGALPEGLVFKYKNAANVFKLEGGKKRHITDPDTLVSLKYRADRIALLRDDEEYKDGTSL